MARSPSPPAAPASPPPAAYSDFAGRKADPATIRRLLHEAKRALRTSQGGLGEIAGASRRTGQRWAVGASLPAPFQLHDLAKKVHPVDRDLASAIAQAGGSSLVELGLEQAPTPPATPPPVPPPPAAPPPAPPPFSPPPDRVVDSVVCAAADAMDMLPRQIRPALLAAFTRAREIGISIGEVEAALRGPEPKPAAKSAAAAKKS